MRQIAVTDHEKGIDRRERICGGERDREKKERDGKEDTN